MGIKAEMTTIDATCGDSSNRLVLQTQCLQGNKGTQKNDSSHLFHYELTLHIHISKLSCRRHVYSNILYHSTEHV